MPVAPKLIAASALPESARVRIRLRFKSRRIPCALGRITRNGRGVYGAHVVAFGLESGDLIGGYTLNADGDFIIAGVREGPHILRVEPLDDADVESFFAPAAVDIAFNVTYGPRIAVVQAGGATTQMTIEVRPK